MKGQDGTVTDWLQWSKYQWLGDIRKDRKWSFRKQPWEPTCQCHLSPGPPLSNRETPVRTPWALSLPGVPGVRWAFPSLCRTWRVFPGGPDRCSRLHLWTLESMSGCVGHKTKGVMGSVRFLRAGRLGWYSVQRAHEEWWGKEVVVKRAEKLECQAFFSEQVK